MKIKYSNKILCFILSFCQHVSIQALGDLIHIEQNLVELLLFKMLSCSLVTNLSETLSLLHSGSSHGTPGPFILGESCKLS